ncbi:MAG: Gfo/Idh/MocA family oxidoreductase [Oscillospiraceae bacterium]|nr:Gfo/Idh/MocA family oxidoreductase [Oscillospiraceae bacterium]
MKHRIAVIGFGGMGGWHVRNIQEKIPELEVAGVWDIREEALAKARELGLHTYASQEELLADPTVDLVTVATPNNFHKPIAIAAMQAGKNVVCEKPVTIVSSDLEDILKVRDETGKLFSVHQNRRWDKDFRIVKAAKEQGLLGELYFAESKVQGSRQSMHGWRGYKVNGGGMLLDWGIHLLDQVMQLDPSPVVEAGAHLLSVFTPEVDDNIKLSIRFESGFRAMLEMSTNCLINSPRWHVQGTGGTLQIDDWSCKGKIMQLKQDAAMAWDDDIVYTEAGPTRTMAPRPAFTMNELPLPEVVTDWADYYRNIIGVLDGTAELIVKPEQTLRVMKVIDLLFKAEEEGQSQKCRI